MVLAKRGFILFALLLASVARAELQIEINQGVENPTPIAVVPFAGKGSARHLRMFHRLSIRIWPAVPVLAGQPA